MGAINKRARYALLIPGRWVTPLCRLGAQVVKSDSATVCVPELEFEIPADTQRGSITTVEGLLRDAADALRALQPERLAAAPAQACWFYALRVPGAPLKPKPPSSSCAVPLFL